jgi:hypothetical protein
MSPTRPSTLLLAPRMVNRSTSRMSAANYGRSLSRMASVVNGASVSSTCAHSLHRHTSGRIDCKHGAGEAGGVFAATLQTRRTLVTV